MRDECQHGSLRRSCERCEDAAEVARLREEVAMRRAQVDSLTEANAALLARAEKAERAHAAEVSRLREEVSDHRRAEGSAWQQREEERARAEEAERALAASEARERVMAQWIVNCTDSVLDLRGRDHGCGECVPGGVLVLPGFRCGLHVARALLSGSSPSPSGGEYRDDGQGWRASPSAPSVPREVEEALREAGRLAQRIDSGDTEEGIHKMCRRIMHATDSALRLLATPGKEGT